MKPIPFILFSLVAVSSCCTPSTQNPDSKIIRISVEQPLQTVEHFGASDAWAGQFVGEYWNDDVKDQIAQWLFSTENDGQGNPKGIGLSLWRVNTGAGSFERKGADIIPFANRAKSYLAASHFEDMSSDKPFEYDWDKCKGLEYFAFRAQELGCDNILLFSNSPLVQLTLNGKGHTDDRVNANLKPEGYARYAEYLSEVASHLKAKGMKIRYISPINEPSVDWVRSTQEGSSWRRSEFVKMVKALDSAMTQKPDLDAVKIYVSEAASVKEAYKSTAKEEPKPGEWDDRPDNMIPTLFGKDTPFYIGDLKHVDQVLGLHEYHSNRRFGETDSTRTELGECCRKYGVTFHMSEWCLLANYAENKEVFPAQPLDPDLGDINVGLLVGRMIHDDFKLAGCTSWSYWKAMDNRRGPLIRLQSDDILVSGTAKTLPLLWSIGNFSRFVRPGYRYVASEGAGDIRTLCSTSFLSPDGKQLVTVLVNSTFEPLTAAIQAKGFGRAAKRAHCYLTSADSNLALQKDMSDIRGGIIVPARSLLTIVLDK